MKPHSGTVHKAAVSLCSRWEMVGQLASIGTLDMVIEEINLLLLGIIPHFSNNHSSKFSKAHVSHVYVILHMN
jgi:hypothetical protein